MDVRQLFALPSALRPSRMHPQHSQPFCGQAFPFTKLIRLLLIEHDRLRSMASGRPRFAPSVALTEQVLGLQLR